MGKTKAKSKLPSISLILIMISFMLMMIGFQIIGLALIAATIVYNAITQRYLLNVIKGSRAYNAKDYTTALEQYRKAIQVKSVNAGAIRGYILIELKKGDANKANEYLNKVLKERTFKDSELLSLNISKSLILWKLGNVDEALNHLKNLLDKNESVYIYETLTTLLLVTGKIEESLEVINQGLEYDENNNILRSNFGEANFKLGQPEVAEEIFSTLVEENIAFVEPYYFYAILLKQKGDNDKAVELLEKAVDTSDSLLTTVSKDDVTKLLYQLTPNV